MKLSVVAIVAMLSFLNLYSQQSNLHTSAAVGEKIYLKKCAVCHGKDGLGKRERIPPLANSDYLINNKEASIKGILFGQNEKITVNGKNYDRKMKAIKLSDVEIANVMNYIQNSWGNKNDKAVTAKEVFKIRNAN